MKEDINLEFKLIGLRVLSSCDEKLRKVLKPENTYFFCNDFEDDGEGGIRLKQSAQPLSSSFFNLTGDKNGPQINVSCIVGHNGDGKSSIIELMIRTINNFAFLVGFLSDHKDLRFIPGLYAELYYLIDNNICCISCRGYEARLLVNGDQKYERVYGQEKMNQERRVKRIFAEHNAEFLFYTLVNNYSLYAYNSEEFKSETNVVDSESSWIAALFHKNDAYQTPVVLTPQREKGVINVNREYNLVIQRLSELFFDCRKGKYRISDTERAEGIAFSLEKESKLIDQTISSYLKDKNRGDKNVLQFYGKFNARKAKKKNILDLGLEDELKHSFEFWDHFDHQFYDSSLLQLALEVLFSQDENAEIVAEAKSDTDFYRYLVKVKSKAGKRKANMRAKANVEDFLSMGGGMLTFLQFQRLFLVFEVYKRWLKELEVDSFCSFAPNQLTVKDHAIWYLVYKTIRMLEKYPDFLAGGLADYETPHFFFFEDVRLRNVEKWFTALTKDISSERTHLTLKLRQTLFFLQNKSSASLLMRSGQYSGEIKTVLTISGQSSYLDLAEYYKAIEKEADFAGSLPPPIFNYDFVISRDGSSLYPMSRMSSGERQLLNSASSVVYHLRNLAKSKAQGTKIVYRNVNVVLEEVELYFHPEYQRRFIKYLLEQIRNALFPANMAINLIFVTHSPFILSDIPRQHVLFLRDGKPDRSMQEDTFGANIHTLLQNGFFLNSVPIGEFAKAKIARLFEILNQSRSLKNNELEQLEMEIPLVSEPLLRGQLMRLYAQRKGFEQSDNKDLIEDLVNRIHYLESRLNDNG